MRIAIIGGSGFVGTRLIDILKDSHAIVNIDKSPSIKYNDITTLCDVRDLAELTNQLKGFDSVVLLAAEHRDDVSPISLYYDVNVEGTRNVLAAMDKNGINSIFFTSSVAIYGLNKENPDEQHPADPFNHYGKSKWQAEEILREWYNKNPEHRNLNIIRPTVIFGERNRGNVYNLLKQISGGKFLMVGNGVNKKSMAYVGNIVSLIQYSLEHKTDGYDVFNYVDTPDFDMNQLVSQVSSVLDKNIPSVHLPYWIGMCGGMTFDLLAKITGRKLPISSIRVKKFCATTQYNAHKANSMGFKAPFTLAEGLKRTLSYEFLDHPEKDGVTFVTE
ncbi:MAG: NAD-dependent epimerase/dehydratase family protein [Marinifilaceae bacterium]